MNYEPQLQFIGLVPEETTSQLVERLIVAGRALMRFYEED